MKNLVLFFLILMSCQNKQNNKESAEFKELSTVYKSEHLEHFPKVRPQGFKLAVRGLRFNSSIDFAYGVLMYEAPKLKIKSIIESLEYKSLKTYYVRDENILVLNSSNSLERMGVSKKDYRSNMNHFNYLAEKGELPIPNFSFIEFEIVFGLKVNSPCMLPDEFKIYILDAQPGIAYEAKRTCEYLMPNIWKNGYTRGVAVSLKHKFIIYWFATW